MPWITLKHTILSLSFASAWLSQQTSSLSEVGECDHCRKLTFPYLLVHFLCDKRFRRTPWPYYEKYLKRATSPVTDTGNHFVSAPLFWALSDVLAAFAIAIVVVFISFSLIAVGNNTCEICQHIVDLLNATKPQFHLSPAKSIRKHIMRRLDSSLVVLIFTSVPN